MAPSLYILLDTCLLAGYYAPQTLLKHRKAADRITILINSVKNQASPHLRLLSPEICVAETQTVLSKYAYAGWHRESKSKKPESIHGKTYKTLKKEMREDFHGGRCIESIPLQRYHVLAKHLVAAVDHTFHQKRRNGKDPVNPLGGVDQLIAGTAVWLSRFLGEGRLILVSTDQRLVAVMNRCRKLKLERAQKLGFCDVCDEIGIVWSQSLYPEAVHLETVSDKHLQTLFGAWPLPTTKSRRSTRLSEGIDDAELGVLVDLYQRLGIGRDRLPYSEYMTSLQAMFERATGKRVHEAVLWKRLLGQLKKGSSAIPPAAQESMQIEVKPPPTLINS